MGERERRWIGQHTLRKPGHWITKNSLVWNPQGRRARGRSRMTWERETEAEVATAEETWKELEEKNRMVWRIFVGGLCFRRLIEGYFYKPNSTSKVL
ncbi:hypothetical protein ElyMa_000718900 [Elysia marginata]|uniref:Uncharacterized protein n=1 Tax=Elysia marginata TaxID=1093978 RepID=A0AAV4GMR7_9GAST|nr:hypothetical protein ElyMa_000718900 [Elysia marginata]